MAEPTKTTTHHDQTISDLIIFSLVVFTLFTFVILLGIF
jgi:hypothetical protein